MRMYLLECPACSAKVEIEPDRKSCFCSYCGNKIHLDDGVKRVEITKDINYHTTHTDEAKIRNIEAQERINDKKLQAELEEVKLKERSKLLETLKPILASLLLVLLFCGLMFWENDFFSEKKRESDQQEATLQETVEEALDDIENGNFAAARIKAESVYYTEGWSHEIEEKWDATRKELIKQIDAAEDAAEEAKEQAAKAAEAAEKQAAKEAKAAEKQVAKDAREAKKAEKQAAKDAQKAERASDGTWWNPFD